jgi:hypothetical protein
MFVQIHLYIKYGRNEQKDRKKRTNGKKTHDERRTSGTNIRRNKRKEGRKERKKIPR